MALLTIEVGRLACRMVTSMGGVQYPRCYDAGALQTIGWVCLLGLLMLAIGAMTLSRATAR